MSKLVEWLEEKRKEKRIPRVVIGEALGGMSSQGVARVLSAPDIGTDRIWAIADALGITTEERLELFKIICGDSRLIVEKMNQKPDAVSISPELKPCACMKEIPLISFAQAAGYKGQVFEPVDSYAMGCGSEMVKFDRVKDNDFALTVVGDSMLPDFPDGSVVHVRGGGYPKSGDVVVARIRDTGQVVIKRLLISGDEVSLNSTNHGNGHDFHWKREDDPFSWCYPVIQMRKSFSE